MDNYEKILTDFVKEKLENADGCLKFQHITGHIAQLDDAVRKSVGTKPTEIMKFLRKHSDIFVIEKSGMVSLKQSADRPKFNREESPEPRDLLPQYLENHSGIVIKVFPSFGFITSKAPKASVYFTPACFKGEKFKKLVLTEFVFLGQKVCFNARRGDSKSEYQATKVWTPENTENEVLHPGGHRRLPKSRDTGLFDGLTSEGPGKVLKVFENYGFIVIDNDPKNTVFFAKQNVCNVENVMNLTKIMAQGDDVEYKAFKDPNNKTRWKASKVWLKHTKLSNQSNKIPTGEVKNENGKIYPNSNGAVIKFGSKLKELADADSCHFYMHGTQVKDVCWEFSDGDNVNFDAIKIKSAPGWKALLCWVGTRPNVVVLPEDLEDFQGAPDDEIDDVPETGSLTSKTSGTSSEVSHSSGTSKYPSPSATRNRNSHKTNASMQRNRSAQRNSRVDNKSNSQPTSTRSLSGSSRSSQHSQSSAKNSMKTKASGVHRGSEKIVTNSPKFHSRFENDSGFGSDQYFPRVQKGPSDKREARPINGYNSNDDEDAAECFPTKSTFKGGTSKKGELESKVYANWGDSPYPGEENDESDLDVESGTFSEACEETLRFDENASHKKSHFSNYDSDEKQKVTTTFDESSEGHTNTVNGMKSENSRMDILEGKEQLEELTAVESDIESMLEETKDGDLICEESQIVPYIKRFCDLSGKVLRVYCRYAEIENEHLKKFTSFFWTDLYCNGRPAPDHFDDLNEVLKEGQTVKFNCIEILDDSGSWWHKITMAWKGEKPHTKEMTPEEFISENNLIVSVSKDLNGYEVIDVSCDNTTQQQIPVAPVRKFLTLAVEDEDDLPNGVTEPEKSSDNRPLEEPSLNRLYKEPSDNRLYKEPSDNRLHKDNLPSKEPSDNRPFKEPSDNRPCKEQSDNRPFKEPSDNRQELLRISNDMPQGSSPVNLIQLTQAVGKMFLSYRDSETDVDVIASDVISFVLSSVGMKSIQTSARASSFCEKESQTETAIAGLTGSSVNQNVDLTETSVQTIITGEVIAQSIFTQ